MDTHIRCFFVEPTGRKFCKNGSSTAFVTEPFEGGCPNNEGKAHRAVSEYVETTDRTTIPAPTVCSCGFEFHKDQWGNSGEETTEYRRTDTGELLPLGEGFPVGAMWYAWWLEHEGLPNYGEETNDHPYAWQRGPDNRILCVMCPGGEWVIDSRCSNCDMKEDNKHRCWVRHGVPPDITVDKSGHTCNAGAGSIWIRMPDGWHGFLKNGYLEKA